MTPQPENETSASDWRSPEQRAEDIKRASALMPQAATAGLRFEVYLPPGLAEWVLGFVESGAYTSPSEAVFWMLREQQDLAPHPDLRKEILKRSIEAAVNDPRPGFSHEEVVAEFRALRAAPRPQPAIWPSRRQQGEHG